MINESQFVERTDSDAIYGKPGLDLLVVETPLCRAVIAEQGAQLVEFQAAGREPLLWVSPLADFQPGTSVRGGIPLCLPWFGVNRKDPDRPKHGLVRTETWQLDNISERQSGELELVFTYRHRGSELFAAPFNCTAAMQLGRELKLQLRLENLAEETIEYSWAWHSYFAISDISAISVEGLEQTEYLDNTRGLQRARQQGPLKFPGEVDRVYENAAAQQQIADTAPIRTSSENCRTVIAWNPGPGLAATLADVGDQYRGYVCVEHGNAFANSWQLAAGQTAEAALYLQR